MWGVSQAVKPRANTHEIDDWVRIYANWDFLLDPEAIILERMKSLLPTMRMLDIGVGGGRTTRHFANLVNEYVGIDNDEGMIRACTKNFPSKNGRIAFVNCDCRSMATFRDDYFDFVQFSFNGLDYLQHEDRLKALREIWRVSKKGGFFFFSTHNLNGVDRLFSLNLPRDPVHVVRQPLKSAWAVWNYVLLALRNDRVGNLKQRRHVMINDGFYHTRLKWTILSVLRGLGYFYYSRPEEQVRQLEDAGFRILDVYAQNGSNIEVDGASRNTDFWLHYFCKVAPPLGGSSAIAASV